MSQCIEVNYLNDQTQNSLCPFETTAALVCGHTHLWRQKRTLHLEDDHALKVISTHWRLNSEQPDEMLISLTEQENVCLEWDFYFSYLSISFKSNKANRGTWKPQWCYSYELQICKLWSWRSPPASKTIELHKKTSLSSFKQWPNVLFYIPYKLLLFSLFII